MEGTLDLTGLIGGEQGPPAETAPAVPVPEGEAPPPPEEPAEPERRPAIGRGELKKLDANGDGVIDAEDFTGPPPSRPRIGRGEARKFDTNGDGAINADDFADSAYSSLGVPAKAGHGSLVATG